MTDKLLNICRYIKEKEPNCSNLRMNKLLYFMQALYMVENNRQTLFEDEIQAWAYGPVIYDVYHCVKYEADNLTIEKSKLENNIKKFVDSVLNLFKKIHEYNMIDITYSYDTWKKHYATVDNVITPEEIYNYHHNKLINEGGIL